MKHIAYLKRAITLLLLLFTIQTSFAQLPITGKVVDSMGEPLIGVTILIQGTSQGAITNTNGEYNLSVPNDKSTLVISYVGYRTVIETVGTRRTLDFVLNEDQTVLDDVVVIGYGVQKKSHLTGSVSKYQNENLSDMAVTSVDQALQGRIAGVNIVNTSSEAGSTPEIRVRGMGSISASSEPLVVVDGYPSSDGLSTVDMNDVESVEVLKDAASAAIYGSRGANGVILITTKSGNSSNPKYTIKTYTGFKSAYETHDIMTSQEYTDMLLAESAISGESLSTQEKLISTFNWDSTDWQETGLNSDATIKGLSFSVSGGKDDTKYYVSTNYTADEGIMQNSSYDKFNLRFKMDSKLSKAVDFGINVAPTYTEKESNTAGFIDFVRTQSWLPVYHTEETLALTTVEGLEVGDPAHARHFANTSAYYTAADGTVELVEGTPWSTSSNNPYFKMMNDERVTKTYGLQSSIYLNIQLAKGLSFRTSNGFYIKYSDEERYSNANRDSEGSPAYAYNNTQMLIDLLSENTLNYTKDFDKHSFSVLAGYTANITNNKWSGIYGTGFPTDLIPTLGAATDIVVTDEEGDRVSYTLKEEEALVSLLGRLNYAYDNKYLLSASIRGDGSSKFGIENQWGYFPSVSLGWRITEEPFMKNVKKYMNGLKLRASWGITGTNDIANYAAFNTLSDADYTFGASSSTVTPGLANTSNTLGNLALAWEQTEEYNYGFDANFFGSRLNLTADYYYSTTKSMLLEQPTPSYTGYTNFWNNVGKVRNSGFELDISSYNIARKDFKWNTNFNIAFNDNKLIALGDNQTELLSYGERNEIYMAQLGGPAIQYYGYKTDGVWTSQAEIDAALASGMQINVGSTPAPGTLKIVDTDGNNIIDADDRTAIGSPFPDYTWGFTNTFKYKNVDLSFQIYGSMGGELVNGEGHYQEIQKYNTAFTDNRFISESHPGDGQTPTYSSDGFSTWILTDYLVEDATFVSLRDVTIGYTFSKKLLEKIKLSKLRLYATGQNLFYLWSDDYKGINPEARKTDSSYSSPLVEGYQRGVYPITRTVTFGAEIVF